MIEVKVHYPEDYVPGSDLPLEHWLEGHFPEPGVPILTAYGNTRDCVVPRNDHARQQHRLNDGRLVKVDWCSPATKGDTGKQIITIQYPVERRFYRNIVRVDVVNHDHLLLIICGWNPSEPVKRPLDIFGPDAEPPRDGDHYICQVNSGVESADDLIFKYEEKCPPLDPHDGLA